MADTQINIATWWMRFARKRGHHGRNSGQANRRAQTGRLWWYGTTEHAIAVAGFLALSRTGLNSPSQHSGLGQQQRRSPPNRRGTRTYQRHHRALDIAGHDRRGRADAGGTSLGRTRGTGAQVGNNYELVERNGTQARVEHVPNKSATTRASRTRNVAMNWVRTHNTDRFCRLRRSNS